MATAIPVTSVRFVIATGTYYVHHQLSRARLSIAMVKGKCRTVTTWKNSPHPVTLNISRTGTDTAIVTIEGEYETAPKLLNGTSFNDLEW